MYVVGACPGSRGVLNEQTLNNFNSAAASIIVPILYSAPFIAHYELKTSNIVQKKNSEYQRLSLAYDLSFKVST